MKDSADEVNREAYPEIKSRTKWSNVKAAQEAECSLRIKVIIGVTQFSWAGLGSTSNKVFSKEGPKGKRDTMSEEVRMFEEEQRTAAVVIQVKQCAWTKWNDIEPMKLSWKSLITLEPLTISFLLRSSFDLLTNVTDLNIYILYIYIYRYTDSNQRFLCKGDRGTLRHILSACPQSLQMFTRWHKRCWR